MVQHLWWKISPRLTTNPLSTAVNVARWQVGILV